MENRQALWGNEADTGKQEGTMGKRGTREILENRKALWETAGNIGKQEGNMGKRGRHWKPERHSGKMRQKPETRKALWGKDGRGRQLWKTRETLKNRKALWGNEGDTEKQDELWETRQTLENRKAL